MRTDFVCGGGEFVQIACFEERKVVGATKSFAVNDVFGEFVERCHFVPLFIRRGWTQINADTCVSP